MKGKALAPSVCLPFSPQLRPKRLGLPQPSVPVRKRTKDGSSTRRPFLVLRVLVCTAAANRKLPYPKLQLPPRAVPQAPPVLLSLDPWLTFQAGEERAPA